MPLGFLRHSAQTDRPRGLLSARSWAVGFVLIRRVDDRGRLVERVHKAGIGPQKHPPLEDLVRKGFFFVQAAGVDLCALS